MKSFKEQWQILNRLQVASNKILEGREELKELKEEAIKDDNKALIQQIKELEEELYEINN